LSRRRAVAHGRRRVAVVDGARVVRRILVAFFALFATTVVAAPPAGPASIDTEGIAAMRRLFRDGVMPDGRPLPGARPDDTSLTGADAACARCHRRSGLGTAEGKYVIPSITGQHLYQTRSLNTEHMDQPHASNVGDARPPYTPDAVARAIREGKAADGRELGPIMPRYALDDATLSALVAYLGTLDAENVPGVSADTLRFATIVAPDADPAARDGMLAVLRQFFADRNHIIAGEARPLKHRHGVVFRVTRRWQLDVWELSGAPETWEKQLDEKLAASPVFAVVSGIAGRTWAPVHRFCERQGVPCLLPNTDLPIVNEKDFYPVYFSRGVLLEADLIRAAFNNGGAVPALRRIVQIRRQGDVGAEAAKRLRADSPTAGIEFVDRVLATPPEPGDLAQALADIADTDALVLWLRPGDVAALPPSPPATRRIFLSGTMAGLESAPLPEPWRRDARLAYPAELPDKRRVAMTHPLGWLKLKGIVDGPEWTRVHTYLACQILSETLGEMLDSFVRDYLIERIEVMLSHRQLSAYYPRLSLAQEQRFASKGGYIVRFAESNGTCVIAEGDWSTP